MEITLVAAMDRRGLIGRSAPGGIPWNLPVDAMHFRNYCRGKVVVVGRKTFGEMAGWFSRFEALPLILTSQSMSPELATCPSPEAVVKAAAAIAAPVSDELVVAGGGRTYAALLPMATRLILTEIDASFEGDVFFPRFNEDDWTVVSTSRHEVSEDNPGNQHAFSIIERIRRENPAARV